MRKSINTKRLQAGWDDIYLMKVLGVNTAVLSEKRPISPSILNLL